MKEAHLTWVTMETTAQHRVQWRKLVGGPDMAMGWFIHGLGLVGSEIFAYEMGWVEFSCQKLIIFFHYHNYPTA